VVVRLSQKLSAFFAVKEPTSSTHDPFNTDIFNSFLNAEDIKHKKTVHHLSFT
jgi:hypothetical protein